MSTPPSFDTIFATQIAPALEALEPKRLFLRSRSVQSVLAVVTGIFVFLTMGFMKDHPLYLFLIAFALFGLAAWLYKDFLDKKEVYRQLYKQTVIGSMVKAINPELLYAPEGKVEEWYYDNSQLYTEGYDVYRGEDFVGGQIGATRFSFSELQVMQQRQQVENSDMKLIFQGLFFVADFNKNFNGCTYVWNREQPGFNMLNKAYYRFADNLEKVLLEDPEFMAEFIVYSDDQVESRYLLSPSLMKRIMNLVTSFTGKISLSFVSSHICLAIPFEKDLFEPSVMDKPYQASVAWFYELLVEMTGIVEELNLNLRIWTKQ